MNRIFSNQLSLIVCLSFMATSLFPCAVLAATCEQWIAKAVSVEGTVEVQRGGETQWQIVKLDDTFCPGDTIRVDDRSRTALSLTNQPLLRLDQNTTITLGGLKEKQTSVVTLARGAVHFFSRIRRNLEVMTGFVNAGVEGTEGLIRVEEDRTLITIYDGQVLASNAAGSLTLTGGKSAVAEAGKAPVERVVVRPRDAVHWALYYPPVMLFAPGEIPKEDSGDPRFLAYRASRLLAVGRVGEAGADIQKALSLDPKYSDAYALQAIIFVVQNEKDKALGSAQTAVDTGPSSAKSRIAMSYARQANFDLEGARASIEEAVKLNPDNALAWARLAELWSSFGRLGKALDAAQKAVALDPNLARTQMVLGFAYLNQVKTTESRSAFEKAIELDQADPLSRLGLGLAKIRDGDLEAGGREVEIAASLDPNNSLVRSYLGKTYFEEKRTGLDEREYAIAKELDPSDPTPWFYDAIAKQTTNRPVEALHDYEKAIELNDNRAVFRSKLQLDSDLAARSAAIARIYNNLGFGQRGLLEGYNSVNSDPSDFSGHRFLADTYSVLPRHEIARVSELLQSQLLQPTNITPIQPALAESNLFLISSSGPANLSFNEFNPIFNRNRAALQANGLVGENSTWAGEGIVSGIYNKLSLSAGYNHFETDGWRTNADQDDDIANLFAQYEFSYKTSLQAEYRYRDIENGDLQLRFFEDNFSPNLREDNTTRSIRLGLRHSFTPGSVLIGNFAYQKADREVKDEDPDIFFKSDLDGDDDAYSGELSYLFRSNIVNLVTGGGYFDIDSDDDITREINLPPIVLPPPPFPPGLPPIVISVPPLIDSQHIDRDVQHTNLYLYSYLQFPQKVTWTLGASGDFYDSDLPGSESVDQFNPKFGVTWNPLPGTTLRGAAFRTLKRTLITDQTLEPTQVAGFNQFYDDLNATKSWVYGAAIDQKLFKSIFGGAEFVYRDLDVPSVALDPPDTSYKDWTERTFRAYLNWAPHNWFSLTAEYLYEDFDRDEELTDGADDLKTHYVPLGINFFHPSGFSAFFKATYVDQKGDFQRLGTPGFDSGSDNFWLADAAVSYRLPKRYGFISVGASNLFDEDFRYFEVDRDNPRIQPERNVFARVTFAF